MTLAPWVRLPRQPNEYTLHQGRLCPASSAHQDYQTGPLCITLQFFQCSLKRVHPSVASGVVQLLPDNLTLPLLWGGLIANLYGLFVPLADAVIGAIAGYLALWTIYWLFKLIRGKEGMGYGDFKLLAALGAWLGWKMLPLIVLGSSVVGAAIGIALVAFKGRDHNVPLAFGPYLAIAGAVALFFGPTILQLYFPG